MAIWWRKVTLNTVKFQCISECNKNRIDFQSDTFVYIGMYISFVLNRWMYFHLSVNFSHPETTTDSNDRIIKAAAALSVSTRSMNSFRVKITYRALPRARDLCHRAKSNSHIAIVSGNSLGRTLQRNRAKCRAMRAAWGAEANIAAKWTKYECQLKIIIVARYTPRDSLARNLVRSHRTACKHQQSRNEIRTTTYVNTRKTYMHMHRRYRLALRAREIFCFSFVSIYSLQVQIRTNVRWIVNIFCLSLSRRVYANTRTRQI